MLDWFLSHEMVQAVDSSQERETHLVTAAIGIGVVLLVGGPDCSSQTCTKIGSTCFICFLKSRQQEMTDLDMNTDEMA